MTGKRKRAAVTLLLASICLLITTGPLPHGYAGASRAQQGWREPINISNSREYDNIPSIAAAPDGSVAIVWERRAGGNPSANLILGALNGSRGGGFSQVQIARSEPARSSGSPHVRRDPAGRRHVVWWQQDAGDVCDYYARVEADGKVSVVEQVPGSCGLNAKNTALAVGPDNSAHALFGRNLNNLFYWVRTDAGWTVQREPLPHVAAPEAPTLGVTSRGVVIAAWKDNAPGGNADVYAAVRQGPGRWARDDLSAGLTPGCEGKSKTDRPALASDHGGGMRVVWADERCDPRNDDPTLRDVYYREWVPDRGWATPPVRVNRSRGNALENAVVVDFSGTAHIMWTDTLRVSSIVLFYASGRGTTFTEPTTPFLAWAGDEPHKDVALGWSPGYIHAAFSSTRGDPEKENYYSYLPIAEAPPPPPPAPPPQPPPPAVPGSGSMTFPETGKTVSGVFLDYWRAHGGLPQQGFPIGDLRVEVSEIDGKPYTVQYFERAVFEYHPENLPPYNVLLSQLGTLQYRKKYPSSAPGQQPNATPGSMLFSETGKRVGGRFLEYWRQNGGLMQQGFPISEEFQERSDADGKTYTVQYFERAVFEYHPGNRPPYDVLLSLLGVFQQKQKGLGGR